MIHQFETYEPDRPDPGPRLIAGRQRRAAFSPLAMWHLLSLDAPSVATVWTLYVAHCAGVALPWASASAMFVAVWMIYAADRLMDARLLDAQLPQTAATELEERHLFHHRHRGRFLVALLLGSAVLVALLPRLAPAALSLYALLATLLATWMLLIHIRPMHGEHSRRLPKELAVGMFFPAAVFIPAVARAPLLRPSLLPAALLLAGVCTFNCLLLYAWEHPWTMKVRSNAHWTTLFAVRHLRLLGGVLLLLCCAVVQVPGVARGPAIACGLSTAMLMGLHQSRHRFSAIHLRAAADLVLLTPLLLMAMGR